MEMESNEDVDVTSLMQQVDPFLRSVVFCKLLRPGVNSLPLKVQTRIVQQHLAVMGLSKTLASLEGEANLLYLDPGCEESVLVAMIRRSMRAADEVYDLYMASKDNATRLPELDECLFRLGLLDVSRDEQLKDEGSSVWSERLDTVVLAPDGSIKAASVNQLILKLTSTETDLDFLKTFLMTYQSFIRPARLLAKLVERFEIPPSVVVNPADVIKIKSRCVNVLKQWLTLFGDDFDESMISTLNRFVAKMGVGALADSLRQPIARLMSRKDEEKDGVGIFSAIKAAAIANPPEPIVDLKTVFLPDFSLSMMNSEELARQLTLIFHDVFVLIRPSEMLDAAWTKPNKRVIAPNVCRFIALFNQISYLAAFSIVNPSSAKARGQMYRMWVKVGQHLLRLQNFTGLMAVLAAFNTSAVHRLKQTVKEVPPVARQALVDLERVMSSSSSFKAYRDLIGSAAPPSVPYVGLLLQDLTFVETNPNRVEGGLVSWSKRTKIYECVDSVMRFQSTKYNLMRVPQIQQYILTQPLYSDDELYALSQQREPRDQK